MRNHRMWIAGVAAALALGAFGVPASVFSEVERDAAGAVGKDASKLTQDQRELLEFETTLAALDDALMRNHLENYYTLNERLRNMMEREIKQSRARLHAAEEKQAERRRAQRMRATMGGSGVDFLDLDSDHFDLPNDHEDIATAKKRAGEMEKLVQRFEALQVTVHEHDSRAYARNAALLDRFLQLMRAENQTATDLSKAGN